MEKKVWLWNHYATSMALNKGGRHYWFAENLIKQGYEPTIFCANTYHNQNDPVNLDGKKHTKRMIDDIPFVYVKAKDYTGNGIDRVLNMTSFYRNLFPVAKEYAKQHGKPDVILASSVHPLTMVAGIKIAKKFGIPCICEVRDLWPESLVAYDIISRNNPLTKGLYSGERWIYKKADAVVMTWPGGKDYILEQGWDNVVNMDKVHHISNGVVVDSFDENSITHVLDDADLTSSEYFNIIYAGSIRKVNNLGMLIDAAKIIAEEGYSAIRFLIYGSGAEKDMLIERCKAENVSNVIFKGRVSKQFVPSILKQADINILHNTSTSLDKYGQSQNKLFEYLAAGKCIIQTYTTGYSVLDQYNCGLSVAVQDAEQIAKVIVESYVDKTTRKNMGINARSASFNYDFSELTLKLIDVIKSV